MREIFVLLLVLVFFNGLFGQNAQKKKGKVYKLNYVVEIPATIGLFTLNYYGFQQLKKKTPLDNIQVTSLEKRNVWSFDRIALNQTSSQRHNAQNISDWGQNIAIFAPILLAIDKDIRHDWFDVALLYLETQAINSNLYT